MNDKIKDIKKELNKKNPNIKECIEILDTSSENKGEIFDLLLEKADIPTLVNEVYIKYNGKYDKIVELIENSKLNSITTKKVKVIGMYYPRLTNGGIERVMEHLTKLYVSMGYRVVLITDTPSEQDYVNLPKNAIRYDLKRGNYLDRAENIQNIVKKEKIDTMIYHSWLSNILVVEMMLYKALGVSFVVYTHGVFSYLLIEPSNYFNYMPRIYSVADAIACLGDVNASYWKNCNINVSTVQNPPTFNIKSSQVSKLENNTILWVGRISPEKKPYEVLLILAEVCKEVSNVKLKIVGKPHNEKELDLLKDLSKKLGIENNVEFCGFHEDVSSFFLESSVLLSTSKCEGFGLSLLEGKTFGVPIVLYELPYLTLSKNNRGMLPVKFGDHKNASNEIIKLFNDRELLNSLGQESRNHALELAEYDYQSTWNGIFSSLCNTRIEIDLNKPEIVMFNTLLQHNSFQQIEKENYNKLNNIQKITPKIDTSNYKNEFYIVFISEEKNIKSLAVAVTSLLENKDTSNYKIYILHKDKYTIENADLIKNLENKYECTIVFKKIDKSCKSVPIDIKNTISNTLDIDKCIYLSYDVVVQKNLAELYNTNIENYSIGAVKEGSGFNTSVLLIDTETNNNNIKSIELKYNINAEYFDREPSFNFNKQVKLKIEILKDFSKQELKCALRDNVIFSYQNDVNPLTSSECSFCDIWVKYLNLVSFHKDTSINNKKTTKIGIITHYHNSLNIGGNLQAYALTKFLNNIEENCAKQISLNMGHYNYQFFRKKQEKIKNFNESIPHTLKVYAQNQSIESTNDQFDVFITGSDQVWTPNWFKPQFFLTGITKRKISYAASMAVNELTTEQIKIMDLIKNIDYISVREKTAENLIKEHLENQVTTVVDSVLLLDIKHWEELSIKPKIKEKYAFAHFLGNGFEGRQLAIESAKIQKLSLAHIPYLFCRYNDFDEKWGDIKDVDAGPREFLGLILNSDFVYTDSFHCVVFAIIFRKNFIVVERVDNNSQTMFSRISDFLTVVGLMDRIVLSNKDITDDLLNKDIDYDKVYKKLNKFKNHSLEFLIKAFENTSLEDKLKKFSFKE